jgi:hypothetical protein
MGYTTRQFSFLQDNKDMLHLRSEVLQDSDPQRIVNMFMDKSYGTSVAWLIFKDGIESPVGSVSAFPLSLVSNGKKSLLGVNCDMLILKEHRTLGPALMVLKALMRGCRELGYSAMLAKPNEKAQPVFKRAGFKKTGTTFKWNKVIRSEDKTSAIIKWSIPRKTIALFIDLILKFVTIDSWIKFRYFKLRKNFVERKDVTLEQLYLPNNQDEDALEKSPEYLKWRYSRLCQDHPEIFALYHKEQLTGCLIYIIDNNRLIIKDVFLPKDKDEIHILLSRFFEKMTRQKHSYISIQYYGSKYFEKILKLHGFKKRRGRDVFINILNSESNDIFSSLGKLSWFEGDLDL